MGFLLNDEMDDFAAKQGVPNMFGLIQGPANAIGPGKRPLSAMAPTIVLKDGKLFLVLGSPGGPRIITTVANILMGVVDYGMNIQEAVNAPRFHHQWLPDVTRVEAGFSPDTSSGWRKWATVLRRQAPGATASASWLTRNMETGWAPAIRGTMAERWDSRSVRVGRAPSPAAVEFDWDLELRRS